MSTTIIFIRHGETDINKANKLHIQNDLEGLNAAGKVQMHKVAERLKSYTPSIIYSSKEARAIQSAQIIATELGISTQLIDGFQERDWGDLTTLPWSQIQDKLDQMSLEERFYYQPPNGESWEQLEKRLIFALMKLIEKHKDETIGIVTHGGSLRALMPCLLNAPKDISFQYDFANASLTIFDYAEGVFTEQIINNTAHLNAT